MKLQFPSPSIQTQMIYVVTDGELGHMVFDNHLTLFINRIKEFVDDYSASNMDVAARSFKS